MKRIKVAAAAFLLVCFVSTLLAQAPSIQTVVINFSHTHIFKLQHVNDTFCSLDIEPQYYIADNAGYSLWSASSLSTDMNAGDVVYEDDSANPAKLSLTWDLSSSTPTNADASVAENFTSNFWDTCGNSNYIVLPLLLMVCDRDDMLSVCTRSDTTKAVWNIVINLSKANFKFANFTDVVGMLQVPSAPVLDSQTVAMWGQALDPTLDYATGNAAFSDGLSFFWNVTQHMSTMGASPPPAQRVYELPAFSGTAAVFLVTYICDKDDNYSVCAACGI
jgi:hypothetical protein